MMETPNPRRKKLSSLLALVGIAAAIGGAAGAGVLHESTAHAQSTNPPAYVIAFAKAQRTPGTFTSPLLYPPAGAKGYRLYVNATARSSPATLVANVNMVDPMSGTSVAIPNATSVTISSATTTDLVSYPNITTSSNRRVNDVIVSTPAAVPITVTAVVGGTAGSVTFGASINWISRADVDTVNDEDIFSYHNGPGTALRAAESVAAVGVSEARDRRLPSQGETSPRLLVS